MPYGFNPYSGKTSVGGGIGEMLQDMLPFLYMMMQQNKGQGRPGTTEQVVPTGVPQPSGMPTGGQVMQNLPPGQMPPTGGPPPAGGMQPQGMGGSPMMGGPPPGGLRMPQVGGPLTPEEMAIPYGGPQDPMQMLAQLSPEDLQMLLKFIEMFQSRGRGSMPAMM